MAGDAGCQRISQIGNDIRNNGGSGGVSEDRVNELINEALGVIENGTY
jgi:hypothetical protein